MPNLATINLNLGMGGTDVQLKVCLEVDSGLRTTVEVDAELRTEVVVDVGTGCE